jgi:cytosine/uracil/thiamine/allantoin permease
MALYNLIMLLIGAVACFSMAGMYMYLHRGWKNNTFAKLLIPSLLAKGVLFTWVAVFRLFPEGVYRMYVSSGLFTVLVAVMVYRAFIYFKEEIALSRER